MACPFAVAPSMASCSEQQLLTGRNAEGAGASFAERRRLPFRVADSFLFHATSANRSGSRAVVIRTHESNPLNSLDIAGAAASTAKGPHRMARRQIYDPLLRNWSIEPKLQPSLPCLDPEWPADDHLSQTSLRHRAEVDNIGKLWEDQGQLQPSLDEQRSWRRVRKDFRKTNDTSDIDGNQSQLRIGRNSEGVWRPEPTGQAETRRPVSALERRRGMRTPWPDEALLSEAIASGTKAMRRVEQLLMRQGFRPEDRAQIMLEGRERCANRVRVIRPSASASLVRQRILESRRSAGLLR
eukprot:scaffold4369_cov149-Isochrysis_galbana.AAC.3